MNRLPRGRRFTLLVGLAVLGSVLFLPFLNAGAPTPLSAAFALTFVLTGSAVAGVATWLGLAWADHAGLPMPLLRAFEARAALPSLTPGLLWGTASGVAFGVAGIGLLRVAQVPGSGGSVAVRIGSALFAAVTLESLLHLAIMSGVVRATGRVGLGILFSTLAFVAFHLSSLGGQTLTVIAIASAGNAVGGLLFGVLYARYGYEYLILAHLIAHAITVGFA